MERRLIAPCFLWVSVFLSRVCFTFIRGRRGGWGGWGGGAGEAETSYSFGLTRCSEEEARWRSSSLCVRPSVVRLRRWLSSSPPAGGDNNPTGDLQVTSVRWNRFYSLGLLKIHVSSVQVSPGESRWGGSFRSAGDLTELPVWRGPIDQSIRTDQLLSHVGVIVTLELDWSVRKQKCAKIQLRLNLMLKWFEFLWFWYFYFSFLDHVTHRTSPDQSLPLSDYQIIRSSSSAFFLFFIIKVCGGFFSSILVWNIRFKVPSGLMITCIDLPRWLQILKSGFLFLFFFKSRKTCFVLCDGQTERLQCKYYSYMNIMCGTNK